MHFICSPFGSAGDTHPMLGLALALRRRGHEITFVVNGYFQKLVERLGLNFVELGTEQEFLDAATNPDLWHPMRGFRHIFQSLVDLGLRQQYDIFAAHFRPGQSIGLINCLGFGGLVAQDKLGLPVVTINLQPGVIWSDVAPPILAGMFGPRWLRGWEFAMAERFVIDPIVCPGLNAFRRELGLPPVKRIPRWWHSRSCVACMFPDWYCAPAADWPGNLIQTDFPLWDNEAVDRLPASVEKFLAEGEAPIVFMPGSANMHGEEFFVAAVEACRLLRRRGILLTRFPEQIPDNLPAGVEHFAYVPFSQLLPRAAAVVHHGGVGSTAQGLAAGTPQLIMPLAHDQFDNAARVKRLGAGDWLKRSHFSGRRAAVKLDAMLSSSAVRSACSSLAARLSSKDGCERTAMAIEQWADRAVRKAS